MPPDIVIEEARWPADRDTVHGLFRTYLDGLGVDLTFQHPEEELASLPGKYARPEGVVLLARSGEDAVGVVAYRPFAPAICEMKRLHVTIAWRGLGISRSLCDRLLDEARAAGYRRMVLDTGAWLMPALALYRSLGFLEIPAYYDNPLENVVYMGRDL